MAMPKMRRSARQRFELAREKADRQVNVMFVQDKIATIGWLQKLGRVAIHEWRN